MAFTLTGNNYVKANTAVSRQITFSAPYSPYFVLQGGSIGEEILDVTHQTGNYYMVNIPAVPTGVYYLTERTPDGIDVSSVAIYVIQVQISVHVQNIGWMAYGNEGVELTGNNGGQIEAFKVKILNKPSNMTVKYQGHVQNTGWMAEVADDQICGTVGQGLRLEAFKIRALVNSVTPPDSLRYRAELEATMWTPVYIDGQQCGTIGENRRIFKMQFWQDLGM